MKMRTLILLACALVAVGLRGAQPQDTDAVPLAVGGVEAILQDPDSGLLLAVGGEEVFRIGADTVISHTLMIRGENLVTWNADGEVIWVSDDLCGELCSECSGAP